MKRTISLILAVVLLLSLLLTIVPAAYACGGRKEEACVFADENEDGVCDHCDKTCEKTFADEDHDGVCDHCGKDCKTHMNDENEDGLCDHCGKTRHAENTCAQPKHLGRHRNGRHHR